MRSGYLGHRLRLAGAELPLFQPAAAEALFQATSGLPRKINLLDAERQCCRFLRFELSVGPDLGPLTLTLTGPEGTQQFLEALLDAA